MPETTELFVKRWSTLQFVFRWRRDDNRRATSAAESMGEVNVDDGRQREIELILN